MRKIFWLMLTWMLTSLAGCGGGGGGGGSSSAAGITAACTATMANPLACNPVLSLSLKDAAGAPISAISPERPGMLQATVKNPDGSGLPNILVTFKTSDATAVFTPATGTALTDSKGVARLILAPGTQVGAFSVAASASVSGSGLTKALNYEVAAVSQSLVPTMTLALTDGLATTSKLSSDRSGVLVATLKDAKGHAVPNVAVKFESNDPTGTSVFVPDSGSALSDTQGVARISLIAGMKVGAFTASASTTVNGTRLSATLDYGVTSIRLVQSSAPSMNLVLTDALGNVTATVAPSQPRTLRATLLDSKGAAVPNATVKFGISDDTGTLVPASRSALTDTNGVARISLAAGSQAGAFTASALASVSGTPVNASADYGVVLTDPSLTAPQNMTLALLDPSSGDKAVTGITPDRPGKLKATVRDYSGNPVPNAVVSFLLANDKGGVLSPAAGTAVTDDKGEASVGLLAGAQPGGYKATAIATAGGASVESSLNYSVTFPTLALTGFTALPATLSAGGNAQVKVQVTSNNQPYATPLQLSFTSACAKAGKAMLSTSAYTLDGVATASYTDKGCGMSDTITATASWGGMQLSTTGSIVVKPATAGSLNFVSADTTNIALVGTGGIQRQEFSTLKFQVLDSTGAPAAGQWVDFSFADTINPIGGLKLSPSEMLSDSNGNVTTVVSNGTIPTPIRVVARQRETSLTTLSNVLVVSTGVPDQRHFSMSTVTGNCEGKDFDQACSVITVTLGDHFGNPAPDGTAVNFSAEGGVIDASCITGTTPATTPTEQSTNSKLGPGSGTCSVTLRASRPRPANGRVTVLAYTLGEEDFFDANGNNICDGCDTTGGVEFTVAHDLKVNLFRDDNENNAWTPGEPCIGPNNGNCSTPSDGRYNGVLRTPALDPAAQTVYISRQLVQLFSGSHANVSLLNDPTCTAGMAELQFTVADDLGNIMPANTQISVGAVFGGKAADVVSSSFLVENVVLAVGQAVPARTYSTLVACPDPVVAGIATVTVTTPNKVVTTANFALK